MTSTPPFLTVTHRFRGPERSGNGGYTAGLLASKAFETPGTAITVTLRRPPPLEVAMTVQRSAEEPAVVELRQEDLLIAEASPGDFQKPAPPERISFEAAAAARSSYRGLTKHPFPGCFVCGVGREPGDGLRLAPGLVGEGRTGCVWVPDLSLVNAAERGVAGVEFIWAALDCPGGWTSDIENRPMVLGRMTAAISDAARVGEPVVVVGELLGEDGRKTFTATAIYDGERLLARAEHTWLTVDPTLFG